MGTAREKIQRLTEIKLSYQEYLLNDRYRELLQHDIDKIIEEIARISGEIRLLKERHPEEKIEETTLEFNSKINELWIIEAKSGIEGLK